MYIPRDPAITCPSLFKGSRSLLVLAWLYVTYYVLRPYLIRRVLRVLLAMQCYSCRYGIVYPSYGLYGSVVIYYKAGLTCIWLYAYLHAYNLTWGGPEKWQKRGRAKWVLSRFCHIKEVCSFSRSTLKLVQLFREIFFLIPPCLFTVHIRPVLSPCQASNTFFVITYLWLQMYL